MTTHSLLTPARQPGLINDPMPAGQVSYEERQEEAARLLKEHPNTYTGLEMTEGVAASLMQQGWQPPVLASPDSSEAGEVVSPAVPLFVHQCKSAAGHRRVIAVSLFVSIHRSYVEGDWYVVVNRMLSCRAMRSDVPGSGAGVLRTDATEVSSSLMTGPEAGIAIIQKRGGRVEFKDAEATPLRFYTGQSDPRVESRFSIAYRMGAASGRIDGQLNDDDTVELTMPAFFDHCDRTHSSSP